MWTREAGEAESGWEPLHTTAGSEDGREVFARECGQEQTLISQKKKKKKREREKMDSS